MKRDPVQTRWGLYVFLFLLDKYPYKPWKYCKTQTKQNSEKWKQEGKVLRDARTEEQHRDKYFASPYPMEEGDSVLTPNLVKKAMCSKHN